MTACNPFLVIPIRPFWGRYTERGEASLGAAAFLFPTSPAGGRCFAALGMTRGARRLEPMPLGGQA